MEIFVLDNMIFDKITEDESLYLKILELKNRNKIKLLITSVQAHQLKSMPDTKKSARELLLEYASQICDMVPAPNFLVGIGRVGIDRIGTSGVIVQLSDEERSGKVKVSRNKMNLLTDESIALTAELYEGFLVTDDGNFTKLVRNKMPVIQILDFQGFSKKLKTYE
jgi:hypothetical protein